MESSQESVCVSYDKQEGRIFLHLKMTIQILIFGRLKSES